jgi:DNA (cytosine-5)-methyltransferase 1
MPNTNTPALRASQPEFRFIDLFAGIGGTRLGFERVGGKCVFTSEKDRFARQTYRANFGNTESINEDITALSDEEVAEIPRHNVLVGGFPCQPFSLAGVSKKNALGRPHGFACEAQGTLFFDIARLLAAHKPKAFLLENVKNLVGHDGGRTYSTIMNVLENELGYSVYPKVIDARGFVPQHRERIFLVGFRDPTGFSWDNVGLPSPNEGPRLSSILHPDDGSGPVELPFTDSAGRAAKKYQLSDHLWGYLQGYAAKHRAKGNGFGFGLFGPSDVARTLSARYHKDGAEILIKTPAGPPRRLTPRECARLMGFDMNDQPQFQIPVSDTQAYRQFGNSVVVPLIATIAKAMKPYLADPIESEREVRELATVT